MRASPFIKALEKEAMVGGGEGGFDRVEGSGSARQAGSACSLIPVMSFLGLVLP